MPLVPGLCTQCGATLSVDTTKDCMICNYCGAPFIVEKAINQFSVQYNVTNNIQAQQVIIQAPQAETGLKLTNTTVMGHGKLAGEVVIPEGITRIDNRALRGAEMTSIIFPSTMKEIGEEAFAGCKFLEKVVLNEGLEVIGRLAFQQCQTLKEISLPDSVKKVGWRAFSECRELQTIHFNHAAPAYEDSVFEACPSLTYVELPDTMTELPTAMFRDCTGIKGFRLNQVTRLHPAAIKNCSALEELDLSSVTDICETNFYGLNSLRFLAINANIYIRKYETEDDTWHYGLSTNIKGDLPNLQEVYWGTQRQTEGLSEAFLKRLNTPYAGRVSLGDSPFRRSMFRMQGRCQYCGGTFKRASLFDKTIVCNVYDCSKPKDY